MLLACWFAAALCPLCAADPPTDSLYQLRMQLVTQDGTRQPFDLYRGHPTLLSMFYGSCPASCPMLITSLKVYVRQLPSPAQAQLRVLLVSFDPEHDTPQRLEALAREHNADPARWRFTSAAEPDARKLAALLGEQFRPLPAGGFDHSLLITLLDRDGRSLASTAKLIGDTRFQAALVAATTAP